MSYKISRNIYSSEPKIITDTDYLNPPVSDCVCFNPRNPDYRNNNFYNDIRYFPNLRTVEQIDKNINYIPLNKKDFCKYNKKNILDYILSFIF